MRGRDFLEVCDFLMDMESEASARTRIGRAYYAAFLESRSWCEQVLGYQPTGTGREHSDVPRLLGGVDPDAAASLVFLKKFRNGADYDLGLSAETMALQAVDVQQRATDLIARIDDLEPPAPES
jgi:hypothetical protein